ncbi:hypothetical protein C8R44DRAFT_978471 [Mycena epipterygia]|nr:hypothetical protein C8R44DRAFT_978471 [Mycena epipterygia]
MPGTIPASIRNRQSTERSGSSVSRGKQAWAWGSIKWQRADVGYGEGTPDPAVSSSSSSPSASAAVSLSSGEIFTLSAAPSSVPQPSSSSTAITHVVNLPASLSVSTSTSVARVPIYGTAVGASISSLPTDATSSLDASSTTSSSPISVSPSGAITHAINLPASLSVSPSASAGRVPVYGSPAGASITDTNPSVPPTSTSTFGSTSTGSTGASASASTTTTFSLKLFPPGFPTPLSKSSPSSASLPEDSGSFSVSGTNNGGSASVAPTPSKPSGNGGSATSGGSAIIQEPSATISFSVFFPTNSATTTGTGVSSPAFATTNSHPRTFAHDTGGIVGAALGGTLALALGILLTFFACRRSTKSQKRKVPGLWISPPLLQGDDGVTDAYSPISRRRSRRDNAAFLRPLSFQSSEIPATGDAHAHYDTDTWGAASPLPTSPTASSVAPYQLPLSPEYWTSPTDGTQPHPAPDDEQPSFIIGAKGFMRRLRRGRPSMASRGLLTTLAPVPENPRSPALSMVTREVSPPPSAMLQSDVLISRPTPAATPSAALPTPESVANFSRPWIHRTRGSVGEVAGWIPPSNWTAAP